MLNHRIRVLVVLTWCTCAPAWAGDHFLTIGGGASPDNNQVSLEKNVLYFTKVLAGAGLGSSPHEVFFSDGEDPGRDVQFIDPSFEPPRLNVMLARLNGNEEDLYLQYRTHALPKVDGPSTRQSLTEWFERVGSRLEADDRLFIYFTGHGGRGRPARNTTLSLWNDSTVAVREFAGLLERVPKDVPVVLVMVQCHAGGFADVIFEKGEAPTLSAADRCGFFATTHDRQAAGCTADIDEDNYHEYSTFFFAALHGSTRTGEAVERPDYDGDGSVSFAEAHAYVQVRSDTIDIPVATSDTFLRQFSEASARDPRGLVTVEDGYAQLLRLASPAQRAVMEGLSRQLGFEGDDRLGQVRQTSERIAKQRKELSERRTKLVAEYNRAKSRVRGRLRSRWPELVKPYHPGAQQIIEREGEAVLRFIESGETFKRWEQVARQVETLDEEDTALERKWVKCQRLLRCAETVALAANLEKVASEALQARYRRLVAAEGGTLRSGPPAQQR